MVRRLSVAYLTGVGKVHGEAVRHVDAMPETIIAVNIGFLSIRFQIGFPQNYGLMSVVTSFCLKKREKRMSLKRYLLQHLPGDDESLPWEAFGYFLRYKT